MGQMLAVSIKRNFSLLSLEAASYVSHAEGWLVVCDHNYCSAQLRSHSSYWRREDLKQEAQVLIIPLFSK